jgi:hypothetical protein
MTVSTAEIICSRIKLDDKYIEYWGGLVGSGGGLFTTSQLPSAVTSTLKPEVYRK